MTATLIPDRVLERIWDRIDVQGPDDCWPWKLSTASHGYGQVGWGIGGGRSAGTTAHRAAWTAVHGPIPDGMTIDHICRNRPCCNPAHLRLLTNLANASDNGMAIRTHCPSGHEYTPENIYRRANGHRICRECQLSAGRDKRLTERLERPNRACVACGNQIDPRRSSRTKYCNRKCANAARFLKAA